MYKTLYIIYSQYKAKTPYQTAKYKISDSQITKPKKTLKNACYKTPPKKQKKQKINKKTHYDSTLNKQVHVYK